MAVHLARALRPSGRTAGPRRTLCRYHESGVNFQTGSTRLPVIEIGSQGQIRAPLSEGFMLVCLATSR
eukprot:1522738-Prymnesium_polylepis.1